MGDMAWLLRSGKWSHAAGRCRLLQARVFQTMIESTHEHAPPKLSIIVATYNAAASLPHLLTSIEAQTFKDWELLISDGGSTDQTVSLIQQSPAKWSRSGKDLGIYDAWNQALPHARGQYICF